MVIFNSTMYCYYLVSPISKLTPEEYRDLSATNRPFHLKIVGPSLDKWQMGPSYQTDLYHRLGIILGEDEEQRTDYIPSSDSS